MKAQISLEYMLTISVVIGALLLVYFYTSSYYRDSIILSQAKEAVDSLASSADYVYSLGTGAQVYVPIYIPESVLYGEARDHTILLTVRLSNGLPNNISSESKANVTGLIPIRAGSYKILVNMTETGDVKIG